MIVKEVEDGYLKPRNRSHNICLLTKADKSSNKCSFAHGSMMVFAFFALMPALLAALVLALTLAVAATPLFPCSPSSIDQQMDLSTKARVSTATRTGLAITATRLIFSPLLSRLLRRALPHSCCSFAPQLAEPQHAREFWANLEHSSFCRSSSCSWMS